MIDKYRSAEKRPLVLMQFHDRREGRGGRRAYKIDVKGHETREKVYDGNGFDAELPAGLPAVVTLYRLDAADNYDSGLAVEVDARDGKAVTTREYSYFAHTIVDAGAALAALSE